MRDLASQVDEIRKEQERAQLQSFRSQLQSFLGEQNQQLQSKISSGESQTMCQGGR